MPRPQIACIFAVIAALSLCGCPAKPPAPKAAPVPPAPTLTPAEFLRIGHVALGLLENHKFAEADAELQKILAVRPRDLFALRNLAVSRLLVFDDIDPVRDAARSATARQNVESVLSQLEQVEPESAAPWQLRSRIAVKLGDQPGRITALKQAVEREPQSAPAWWELYQALGGGHLDASADTSHNQQLLAAGQKVYDLQPDNWFFLKDWLPDLATAKDTRLKDVLEQFRPQIEPFAASIERDTRANPLAFIDQALQAIAADQWPNAQRAVRILGNVIKPEVPFDAGRLDKSPFDFVLLDFDAAFDRDVGRPDIKASPAIPVRFEKSAASLPDLPGGTVRDVAWADFDVDGRIDLLFLTATHLIAVVRNENDSWHIATAVESGGDYNRLLAADLDDDDPPVSPGLGTPSKTHLADPDVIITGPAGILVLENQRVSDGERSFVPHRENVPWSDVANVSTAVLSDLDHDGDLDLFTASREGARFWSQRGDFLFLDTTSRCLLPPPEATITAAAVVDWDRDADLDLVIATSAGVRLLENARHGRFRDRPLPGPFTELTTTRDLRVRDIDNNGAADVLAAGDFGHAVAWMQPSLSGGLPALASISQLSSRPVLRTSDWDYDNDGFVDLLVESPERVQAARQEAAGKFATSDVLSEELSGPVRAADFDTDGDLDLVAGATPKLWRNDGGNANHWLDVRVRALQEKGGTLSSSKRVNHEGRGSLIEVRSGAHYQSTIVDGPVTHFGLGPVTQADLVRIVWTNGIPQDVVQPAVDATLFEEQLPIGSCPFHYTWDGERFVFCTDLLWNAPLGLRFAEDVLARWREWEYLKIPGEKLQPRDGQYVLQLTEELWEVAYFDQVRLFAVDHPAEVQVFTNEKVGPPTLADPLLHVVRTPRRPVAARDLAGRDMGDLVFQADGEYARTWDRKLASGLVSDHGLELHLGDLRNAETLTLFLTGWLYPTDTSLNVQFSQHPSLPRPQPPSLWTPDANGHWREVRPFVGFIGGKPKTIALDVSDAFTPGDYRLQLRTNMEFYWDDVFFTVNERPVKFPQQEEKDTLTLTLSHADVGEGTGVRIRELRMTSADLHFRGFSQAVHSPGFGPETYDYERVSRTPQWPPLRGKFTRFGDVQPLLMQRDDQLAVFGAGDEVTVSFAVPADPLPPGWVRDFMIYNVGWDKDANLNTLYGDAAEPLPFEAMQTYGEERPLDAAYGSYLREYQTRTQSAGEFWNFARRTSAPLEVQQRSRFNQPRPHQPRP